MSGARRLIPLALLVVSSLLAPAPEATAAVFEITSSADDGPGTLRDGIQKANATPGAT